MSKMHHTPTKFVFQPPFDRGILPKLPAAHLSRYVAGQDGNTHLLVPIVSRELHPLEEHDGRQRKGKRSSTGPCPLLARPSRSLFLCAQPQPPQLPALRPPRPLPFFAHLHLPSIHGFRLRANTRSCTRVCARSPRRVVQRFVQDMPRRAVVARRQPRVRVAAGKLTQVVGDLPRRRSLHADGDLRHLLHVAKER